MATKAISTSFSKMNDPDSDEEKEAPSPMEIKKNTSKEKLKDEGENERHIILELWIYFKERAWQKKVLTVVVAISACLVFLDFWKFGYIGEGFQLFLTWMKEHPVLGFVSFIALFSFAVVIFVPPAFLVIMTSFVFVNEYGQNYGMILAFVSCLFGAIIGADISYIRSSYMMRDLVKLFSKRYKIIQAADAAIKANGFRVMLLLRLCSIIPFNALNYIGGVTAVTLTDFTLSLLGIIPQFIIYVIIGGLSQGTFFDFNTSVHEVQYLLLVFGLVAALFSFFHLISYARIELDKEIANERSMTLCDNDLEAGVEIVQYEKGVDDEEWFWFFV